MLFDPTIYVVGVLLALLAINFICWAVFRRWPRLLVSENEQLGLDYISRFEGELKKYIPEWFDIKAEDWPHFIQEYRRCETGGHIYEPFTQFRHPPLKGRFLNNHLAGFRHILNQGPWPISDEYFNVFFFGGSTTLNVGPDWTSIPSFFQAIVNQRRAGAKPVRVYNFGRGSYFSTQERILFQQLLLQNAVPDMVIFFDGLNDLFFFNGDPAMTGILWNAVNLHNAEHFGDKFNRMKASPKWHKLKDFMASLPLALAIDRIGTALAKRSAPADRFLYRPIPVGADLLVPAIARYLENRRQIETLCADRKIRALFVWQPSPAYKYDLQYHVALNPRFGLGGHERSELGYTLMAKLLETNQLGSNFVWLADIQENEKKPLYLDNVHYTTEFNRIIAGHIADAVFSRGFLIRKMAQPAL
jgi:hypothetical protein